MDMGCIIDIDCIVGLVDCTDEEDIESKEERAVSSGISGAHRVSSFSQARVDANRVRNLSVKRSE